MSGFLRAALELEADSVAFVGVTLLSTRGEAPADPGAKCLVTADGLHWGTVGGGKIEARAIQFAQELLQNKVGHRREPVLREWNLQRDIGMTCGGVVTLLFEFFGSPGAWPIAVFGAGHVGQALVRALLSLECRITCVDPRADWLERLPESPKLQKVCLADPAEHVESLSPEHFFVVMTQGHATDLPVLESIFRRFPSARYVGAIGSDVKSRRLRADLLARGISVDQAERLRCPIGLKLGSHDPAEIALSVAAQLVQVRDEVR